MNTLEEIKKYIAQTSKRDHSNISFQALEYEIDLFKQLIGKDRVLKVLEVGSGDGIFLTTVVATGLAEQGVGIDPEFDSAGTSREDIQGTKSFLQESELREQITLEKKTLNDLLSEGDVSSYDLIFFRQVLHHIFERNVTDVEDCVEDIKRVKGLLNEDGHICILEVARPGRLYSYFYNLYRKLRGKGKMDWSNKRTKKEWVNILKRAGFLNIKTLDVPLNLLSRSGWLRIFGKMFSCSFVITGKKSL